MFINDVNNFLVDHLDQTAPDHNFLFPEFEIVTEAEGEITPDEAVEIKDYSEVKESMGKESDQIYFRKNTWESNREYHGRRL